MLVISEVAMFVEYGIVAYLFAFYLRVRHVKALGGIFLAFGAVFLTCGCTHLMATLMFVRPWYWLEAVVNMVSAAAGATLLVFLVPMMPKIMRFPNSSALEQVNLKLREELSRMVEEAATAASAGDTEAHVLLDDALSYLRKMRHH